MAPSTAVLFVLYGVAAVLRARLPLHRGAYWLGVGLHGAGALVAVLLFCLSYQRTYLDVGHLGFAAVDDLAARLGDRDDGVFGGLHE